MAFSPPPTVYIVMALHPTVVPRPAFLIIIINIIIIFITWCSVAYKDKCYRKSRATFNYTRASSPRLEFRRIRPAHEGVTSSVMMIGGWPLPAVGRRPQIRLHGHLSSCKEFTGINHTGSSIFSPSAAATFKFILYIRIYIHGGYVYNCERGDQRRIMLVSRKGSYILLLFASPRGMRLLQRSHAQLLS